MKPHQSARGRGITARQLTEVAGDPHHGVANLHYGKLAREVAERAGNGKGDGEVWTAALAEGQEPERPWGWRMRLEVAQALKQLGV